jgi:hypothetical protein
VITIYHAVKESTVHTGEVKLMFFIWAKMSKFIPLSLILSGIEFSLV